MMDAVPITGSRFGMHSSKTVNKLAMLVVLTVTGCGTQSDVDVLPSGKNQSLSQSQARPPSGRPLGIEEFERTGKFPATFRLSEHDKTHPSVVMRTPGFGYPPFKVRMRSTEKNRKDGTPLPSIQFHRYRTLLPTNPNHQKWGNLFCPADGDVFPIYGEVYRISYGKGNIHFTRVTKQIPEPLRPRHKSRTISTVEIEPTLFWTWRRDRSLRLGGSFVFDWVRIVGFDEAKEEAEIELTPAYQSSGGVSRNAWQRRAGAVVIPSHPDREYRVVTIATNSPFTTDDHTLDVIRIVRPQTIPDVGRLVGWIEVDVDHDTGKEITRTQTDK